MVCSGCPLLLLLAAFPVVWSLPLSPSLGNPENQTLPQNQWDITEINKDSDLDLFEGDILTSPSARNAIIGNAYRWPLTVPYYLDDSLELNAKGVILKAFERYRLKSCIDFKPWSGEENYINVFRGSGCYSYVGNLKIGMQVLSIGTGCDTVEIVQHEFYHALGFYHEQSRSDRDDYVSVAWENIQYGRESNFRNYNDTEIASLGVPYDYMSVMHYANTAFSANGRPTLITKNAQFNNIIGKQMDLSAKDTLKLNRLYNCTSSLTFLDSCNFESDEMCAMLQRTDDNSDWLWLSQVSGGPSADHTYAGNSKGYFMHFNTSSGMNGDTAVLESRLFYPARGYQCLEFFYYHSGNESDQLNIWIKQYTPSNPNGTLTLIESIRGKPAGYWQLHYTSLNAKNKFRFVFQGVKGNGSSSGGISIDDINLSETECPHNVWQIRNFTHDLTKNGLYSPPFYSRDGYAFQIRLWSYTSPYNLAAYLYLISGANDKTLQWPCLWKQVTVEFLDQNPDMQQRTSNMKSITTLPYLSSVWNNPALVGVQTTFPNGTKYNVTGGYGNYLFTAQEWLYRRDFLKGGDAFILVSMEDIFNLTLSQPLPPSTTSQPSASSRFSTPTFTSEPSGNSLCMEMFCYNGGTCVIENLMEKCRCITTAGYIFAGERCEKKYVINIAHVWTTPLFTTILMAILAFTAT